MIEHIMERQISLWNVSTHRAKMYLLNHLSENTAMNEKLVEANLENWMSFVVWRRISATGHSS